MANNTLGRGLNSLIPQSAKPAPPATEISEQQDSTIAKDININELAYVVVDKIVKNPYQPRMEFNHEELEQLAESIKRYGILEPLVVTRDGEFLQLIAGERRLQAAILAGLERVPVIIREANKLEMLEISLIENIQRSDLNPLEEALAYQRLIEEFKLTQEEVATKVNKNRSTIANSIRMLHLPPKIQEAIKLGTINRSQAKLILSVADDKQQLALFNKIIKNSLTVRQTSRQARNLQVTASGDSNLELAADEESLRNYLETKVAIEDHDEQGQIVIKYYSLAELKRLINKIIKE
ncbi:MAG: ParB/RepB/Spo0J family partition protein [Candidatus Komeilibacteria bacterium]